ncbi:hypothetical protein FOZ62_009314, partial [Perkinsus olseni]
RLGGRGGGYQLSREQRLARLQSSACYSNAEVRTQAPVVASTTADVDSETWASLRQESNQRERGKDGQILRSERGSPEAAGKSRTPQKRYSPAKSLDGPKATPATLRRSTLNDTTFSYRQHQGIRSNEEVAGVEAWGCGDHQRPSRCSVARESVLDVVSVFYVESEAQAKSIES